MPTRKRVSHEVPPQSDAVSVPVLVGDGRYSSKHRMVIYDAVDYNTVRFRLGDHVSMYTPEGKEWVCILEILFRDPENEQPMFKGRWFWSVQDVIDVEGTLVEEMRPSKCISHELLLCDNRDINPVEAICRKCDVLSYENFQLVKKIVLKSDYNLEKVFYCERQFYHQALRFSELNNVLFPGDPIPLALRKAAGLPLDPSPPDDVSSDLSNAYYEPDYALKPKRKKSDKTPSVPSDPIYLW